MREKGYSLNQSSTQLKHLHFIFKSYMKVINSNKLVSLTALKKFCEQWILNKLIFCITNVETTLPFWLHKCRASVSFLVTLMYVIKLFITKMKVIKLINNKSKHLESRQLFLTKAHNKCNRSEFGQHTGFQTKQKNKSSVQIYIISCNIAPPVRELT